MTRQWPELATRVFTWLRPRLPTTLKWNESETKLAQQKAMRQRRGVLERLAPGRMRQDLSEEFAASFLTGMQTPPPPAEGEHKPHW